MIAFPCAAQPSRFFHYDGPCRCFFDPDPRPEFRPATPTRYRRFK